MKLSVFRCCGLMLAIVVASATNESLVASLEDHGHEKLRTYHDAENYSFLTSHSNHHRRLDDIPVTECLDVTEWFPTRSTDGVNILATFYDCHCSGDFSLYFTLECVLKDYCFRVLLSADNTTTTTERCINHNVTYDFSVSQTTGAIDWIQRGTICLDYIKGGLVGQLCYVDSSVCAFLMKDLHNYSTESAVEICRISTPCQAVLPTLGYTEQDLQGLCPSMTLNGVECNSYGFETCGDSTDELFYRTTPDCSNVESCATESCQAQPRVDPTPARHIIIFPEECNQLASEEDADVTPPPSPDSSDAPTTDADETPLPTPDSSEAPATWARSIAPTLVALPFLCW